MTKKLTATLLSVLLLSGAIFAQTAQRTNEVKIQAKTARLHIDGFMKSKSGAI